MTLKKGSAAIESMNTEREKSVLRYLKIGDSIKVRVPSKDEVVEVMTHSAFGVFNTTLSTPDNLYEKAAQHYYDLAKLETDEKKKKELKDLGYGLIAKPSYYFGFVDLATGEVFITSLSKKQGKGVYASINKYSKKLKNLAFELSRTSNGYSLSPLLDNEEDLTPTELKNFEASAAITEIEMAKYEACLFKKGEDKQLEDLKAYGFDVEIITGVPDLSDDSEDEDLGEEQEIGEDGEGQNYGF